MHFRNVDSPSTFIFKDFDFSEVEGNRGDFIIYGNVKSAVSDLYYGHAFVERVRFMDVMVDHATAIVRGRGLYSEVTDIDARSNGGWAKGHITFSSFEDEIRAPAVIRMKFDAQLRLEDSTKLFGEGITKIIKDFETTRLPLTNLEGALFNKAYPQFQGLTFFDLTAQSNGPIKFKNVPLDYLNFSLYGRSEVTSLRDLTFGFADGNGIGEIDIFTCFGPVLYEGSMEGV